MIRLWLTLGTAGILAASPARAQDVDPPRIEIGGTFSGILSIVSEDGPAILASAGPRVTINVSRRIGIDLLAEVLGPVESGTMALYQAQLKLPFRASGDGQRTLSFTVGAVGLASYRHTRETRITRLDGSTVVYPGFRRFQATAPTTLSIGVSRDAVVGRSFSSSLAVQGYTGSVGGFAVRASVGVAFGVQEAIDDHDLASRDPARGPDGGVRYRRAAPGIRYSGSHGAESSSHCAAVRVGHARRAGHLDEQCCRARIARSGRIRCRRVHQNRSSGPRMAAAWSRSHHTRGRRPHAEHPVSVAPGSRFATWRVPYRARHSALPDDHPGRRIRPNAQAAASGTLDPRNDWTDISLIPGAIHAADRGCVLLSAQLRRKPRRPRSRSDRARPVNA